MSNNQLHLEQDFFDNPNHQEISYLPLPQDDPNPPNRPYQQHPSNSHQPNQDADLSPTTNRFYQEFRRICTVAFNIQSQKQRLAEVVQDLNERIQAIESKLLSADNKGRQSRQADFKQEQQSDESKGKRARRTAEQIQKKFKCEVPFCERYYGSEGSLQQHIKLKHPKLAHRESSDEYRPNARDKQYHSIT